MRFGNIPQTTFTPAQYSIYINVRISLTMSDEESQDKKYAYLSSSKQHVVFLGPPTDRPDIEGFTSVADTKKESFFKKFIAYTKKNPFVLAGNIRHIHTIHMYVLMTIMCLDHNICLTKSLDSAC